ncbi:MAG: hypothetical protein AAF385_16860, partial [Pseudomonadota bacterium]
LAPSNTTTIRAIFRISSIIIQDLLVSVARVWSRIRSTIRHCSEGLRSAQREISSSERSHPLHTLSSSSVQI